MKSTLDGIDNRSGTTKQNISKLEDRNRSYTNKISNKQSTSELWEIFRQLTMYLTEVPRGGGQIILEEIMVKFFLNLVKILNAPIQESL